MKYRKEAVHATNPEVLAAGRRKLVFAALAVLAVVLVAGTWLLVHSLQPKQNDAAVKPGDRRPRAVEKKQATEPAEHAWQFSDCPDTDCIAMASTVICCSTGALEPVRQRQLPQPWDVQHSTYHVRADAQMH